MAQFKKPDEKWGNEKDIKKWLRGEKDLRVSKRLTSIRYLMLGYSRKETARLLDISETTVKNWRKRWDLNGKEGLYDNYIGSVSIVPNDVMSEIENIIEVKHEIDGKVITGYFIQGHLKKNTK